MITSANFTTTRSLPFVDQCKSLALSPFSFAYVPTPTTLCFLSFLSTLKEAKFLQDRESLLGDDVSFLFSLLYILSICFSPSSCRAVLSGDIFQLESSWESSRAVFSYCLRASKLDDISWRSNFRSKRPREDLLRSTFASANRDTLLILVKTSVQIYFV